MSVRRNWHGESIICAMTAHGHAAQDAAAAQMELPPLEGGASGDEAYPEVPDRFLTDEQIRQFLETGVLVVPNVLNEEEIAEARAGLHGELAKYGAVGWPQSRFFLAASSKSTA